jgi:hypothetical protein
LREFFNWFKTVRKELRYILYAAVLSVLLFDFWLFYVPSLFPYAYQLGQLWYKICLAYITSFIFYYVNVHIQGERLKSKTMIYVNNKITSIHRSNVDFISSISPTLEDEKVTKADYVTILTKINPHDKATFKQRGIDFDYENWFIALDQFYKINKELIHDTLLFKDSINSDVLGILSRIDDNLYNHVNIFKGIPTGNLDLSIIADNLHYQFKLSEILIETFNEKHREHLKVQSAIFKNDYRV